MGPQKNKIGAIFGMGYIYSYCYARKIKLPVELIQNFLQYLLPIIEDSNDWEPCTSVIHSVGLLGRYLPLQVTQDLKEKYLDYLTKYSQRTDRLEIAIESLDALSNLSLGEEKQEFSYPILKSIFNLSHQRSTEHHLRIGNTLSTLLFGWQSRSSHIFKLDGPLSESKPQLIDLCHSFISHIVSSTFNINSTPLRSINAFQWPPMRLDLQVGITWLIAILGNSPSWRESHLENLQEILLQWTLTPDKNANTTLLVDNMASIGLVLLSQNQSPAFALSLRDKVFQSDIFKISTKNSFINEDVIIYLSSNSTKSELRNLLQIAEIAQNIELIFPFIALFYSNNEIWKSDLGKIILSDGLIEQALSTIKIHLEALLPQLLFSSFDGSAYSKTSEKLMIEICSKVDISPYFRSTMTYLVDDMKKASYHQLKQTYCEAITYFIQGKDAAQLNPYSDPLWKSAFWLCVDESPKLMEKAIMLLKNLGNITISFIQDKSSSEESTKFLDVALQNLHNEDIAKSHSTKKTAFDVLKKILRAAISNPLHFSRLIQNNEFLPSLIRGFLIGLELDIKILHDSTEKKATKKQLITNLPIQIERQLPPESLEVIKNFAKQREIISFIVQSVTEKDLEGFIIQLILLLFNHDQHLVASIGAAETFILLFEAKSEVVQPTIQTVFQSLLAGLTKQLPSPVQFEISRSLCYLCKITSPDYLQNYIRAVQESSSKAQDNEDDLLIGRVLLTLYQTLGTALLNKNASLIFPIIYLGKFSSDSKTAKLFEDVLAESQLNAKEYVDQVLGAIGGALDSPEGYVLLKGLCAFEALLKDNQDLSRTPETDPSRPSIHSLIQKLIQLPNPQLPKASEQLHKLKTYLSKKNLIPKPNNPF
eukprot:TRINITY_DN3491_c0_g2_i1.p1 TRINITY_DN3491_c0_g2~~TRINITY_DN3491_c0_g2_i1.p1  ORF type:complete len:876 (-),score=182.25 TRINITY_DN3491_c0_g2_i1:82-2709(-)